MIKEAINNILLSCNTFPAQLRSISAIEFNYKPANKWSKKEIVGHLIDSAVVNLQRLIRGQVENSPQIYYDQDNWVAVQRYQEYKDEELIVLWESLNRHLVHVITHIPASDLSRTCLMRNGEALTLQFLADDYYAHLQHHAQQILS